MSLALGAPGPFEILILLLFFGVPILLIVWVVTKVSSPKLEARGFEATPVAYADGPGSYRVAGVDKQSRADRDIIVQADSRANAQVKAELDGIIVTSVIKSS